MYKNSKNNPQVWSREVNAIALPASKRPLFIKVTFLLIIFLALLAIGRQVFAVEPPVSPQSAQVVGAVSQPEAEPNNLVTPKRQINTSGLQASMSQIIKKYPYDTSVSVIDLNSGTLIQTGDSYPFIAASTTKLMTTLLYLNNIEVGQASLTDQIGTFTAGEQLKLAINQSDNAAWQELNNHLGKDSLAAYAKVQGIESYDPARNTITSNDMARLMAKLYNHELLNKEHTKLLLSWMQNTSDERFIPAGLPQGITSYHKAGYLNDRVHDVAIIDNGSAPFVLVVYSKSYTNNYDFGVGQKLFKQVATQAVTTFQ